MRPASHGPSHSSRLSPSRRRIVSSSRCFHGEVVVWCQPGRVHVLEHVEQQHRPAQLVGDVGAGARVVDEVDPGPSWPNHLDAGD
jgi:hypothetical protein